MSTDVCQLIHIRQEREWQLEEIPSQPRSRLLGRDLGSWGENESAGSISIESNDRIQKKVLR